MLIKVTTDPIFAKNDLENSRPVPSHSIVSIPGKRVTDERTKRFLLFTDKEEEFVNLLIEIGTKKTVAQMLVFLANTPEATSRELERRIDLHQPEVNIAIKYLAGQCWIKSGEAPS